MRGRISRYNRTLVNPTIETTVARLGSPISLELPECLVFGDVQLPTTDLAMLSLMLDIAQSLRKPRTAIIAGDFINADAFSGYDPIISTPSFREEVEAARWFMGELLKQFKHVIWIQGNHERRVSKRTRAAILPEHLHSLIVRDHPRVTVSHWGHCLVNSGGQPWRITHARNYSVNQLFVADQLAQKYQRHIIQHHEHHLAVGWDRYKRYVVVNNGGLFARETMDYAVLDDSKAPNMTPGFTLLRNGSPYLFGLSPFTDYDYWLPKRSTHAH